MRHSLILAAVLTCGCSALTSLDGWTFESDAGDAFDAAVRDAGADSARPHDASHEDSAAPTCTPGMTRPCGVDTGECAAGLQRCSDGDWDICDGAIEPSSETCDGLDNDCDGMTDGPAAAASCSAASRATMIGCSAGACVVTGCATGYADCDRLFDTGCEAMIGTVDACTACGDACDWNCGGAGGCNDAVHIVSGLGHHCALLEEGDVICWGDNSYGQLGDGTTLTRLSPVRVPGLSDIDELTAGLFFTCARTNGGTVYCWGRNDVGQLGDGTMVQRENPTAVMGLSTASAIGAGNTHACAVVTGGFVRCWGDNASSQLGDGTTARRLSPVSVSGLAGMATDVTGGSAHSCALMADGTVRCWGNNGDGQIGDGTTTNRPSPTTVPGVASVVGLDSGSGHTCAVSDSGTLWCWGRNVDGQVGSGSTLASVRSPAAISLGAPVAGVSAGSAHTCAATSSGSAFCWGDGGNQIGDGSSATSDRRSPVAVVDLVDVAEVSAGGGSCARSEGGSLWCWGGRVGDGTTTSSNRPVAVSSP